VLVAIQTPPGNTSNADNSIAELRDALLA